MELVLPQLGLPKEQYRTDDRLKEIHFGEWEGLTWREIAGKDPEGLERRKADPWNFTPPANGENYHMLAERVLPFLNELKRDSVIVSHGGIGRTLLALVAQWDKRKAPLEDIFQGQILLFKNGAALWT